MNIYLVLLISFFLLSVIGSLTHFTHGWFKKGILLHMFSALNESTWEHMKMLVAPTILVGILQYIFLRDRYINIFNSILILMSVELITMPLLYETLKRLVKKVPFPITILIFFLSIIFGLLAEYLILSNGIVILTEIVSFILVVVIVGIFGIFSYYPPKISLLKDPITGRYGDR